MKAEKSRWQREPSGVMDAKCGYEDPQYVNLRAMFMAHLKQVLMNEIFAL